MGEQTNLTNKDEIEKQIEREVQKRIAEVEREVQKRVAQEVKNRIASHVPQVRQTEEAKNISMKDFIKMSYKEKLHLYNTNRKLFEEVSNKY